MSGSFWRFGNGYNEVSSLNALLENAFVPTLNRQRTASTSTSSSESTDSEDDNTHGENPDETIEEEENDFTPNLDILGQLLDEQDILDELATSNLKLIEFLRHREVLEELIKYIVTNENDITEEEPLHPEEAKKEEETEAKSETSSDDKSSTTSSSDSEDMSNLDQPETPQETHARRAQVAAEILSSDSWSLTDSFMDNHDLLDKLWCVLDNESLSMVLSTYFMKINEHLLDLKIDEMLNFLLNQNNLVDRFIRHIDNPPLMDFLLKVISTDKPDASTGIIECLKDQGLIPKLVDFLHPDVNPSIQSAAGDFIKAFVTISANSNADNSTIGPNELTRELVSEPIMEKLCGLMLNGGTSLANGVGIIIEIIRKNNSDYDFVPVLFITIESHPPTSRDSIYLGHLIKVFSRNIPKFAKMLGDTKLADLDTPFGSIEPLGFERFKICELIAELLHCSNMALLNDVSGEEIVRERDIERERVIALEKQQRDEEFDTDAAMSRDVSGLALEAEDEKESDETDLEMKADKKTEDSEESEDTDTNEKQLNEFISENAEDASEEQSTPAEFPEDTKKTGTLESEPDSDGDGETLEIQYDENEAILRKDPVVGDLLKIALADNGVILMILKMFFRFPWNNFLHNVVFDIVQQILNGSMKIGYNKYLSIDLFGRGQITKLIIEGQEKCESYEEENGLRLGYMGHLTLIAEEVVKFTALFQPSTIHQLVLDAVSTSEWTLYVTKTLVETREKYNALLGGEEAKDEDDDDDDDEEKTGLALDPNVDHDIIGSGADLGHDNDDDDDEHRDGDEDEGDQFSRYISQQMTNDLPDKFGSSDEDDDEDDVNFHGHQIYSGSDYFQVDDDDDYVDPNDDGQSYTKKDHPFYHDMVSPTSEKPPFDDDEDESSSDEDDIDADRDVSSGTGLTRTKSKGELNWDDDEQNRLINMASYIKTHTKSPSSSNDADKQ